MVDLFPVHPMPYSPAKRMRRTATAVMAGSFDIRPSRDVLTSLLNGVGPYQTGESQEEERRRKRKEKRDMEHSRKRRKTSHIPHDQLPVSGYAAAADAPSTSNIEVTPLTTKRSVSSFWSARRPIINLTGMRSPSMTPPPLPPIHMPSTPASTPGPSISSSTSRTSSKRPHTPGDDEELDELADDVSDVELIPPPLSPKRSRKKRFAAKKGWKGWVEGSPQPSEKLINLDAQVVLVDRRTRSGKSFDAY